MKRILAMLILLTLMLFAFCSCGSPDIFKKAPDYLTFEKSENGYKVFVNNAQDLTEIEIPATYRGKPVIAIEESALWGCSKLTALTIPFVGETIDTSSPNTHFGYLFGAKNTEENKKFVPITLRSVTVSGGSICSNAFEGCNGITSVTIKSDVKSIGKDAFKDCNSLATVYIEKPEPYLEKEEITSFLNYVFDGYKEITSLIVADSIIKIKESTSNDYIGSTSFSIPDGVTQISNHTFSHCSSLVRVLLPNSATEIGE